MTAPVPAALTRDRAARYDPFVGRILDVCRAEPRRRSELRRGLRLPPERAATMHAVVAPWLPDRRDRASERAYYTVAAMIAAQPRDARDPAQTDPADPAGGEPAEATPPSGAASLAYPGRRPNLGWSLAEAVRRDRQGRRIASETAEKRLHLLVRQNLDGVHRQLPGVVGHLRALNVTVDWAQLMSDLARWTGSRDQVTKAWLQTFYRTLTIPTTEESTTDD
jgi:CRISPR system Cascade subunit CasB